MRPAAPGRGDAQLLVEHYARVVVDAHRLGDVALSCERVHQQRVAGLSQRRALDQAPGGAFGSRQLGAADAEAASGVGLECAVVYVIQALAPLVEPGGVVLGQQPPAGDELGAQRGTPRPLPVAQGHGGLRLVDRREAVLDVDPRWPTYASPW